jgi:hypothetical protein
VAPGSDEADTQPPDRLASPEDPIDKGRDSEMKLLYSSSNGDRWFLVQRDGRSLVRHEPNLPSGGAPSETDAEEFLRRDGRGPEHEELRRHIEHARSGLQVLDFPTGSPEAAPGRAARPVTAAQVRAGRGLLGWSEEALAREAHLSVADVALCESGKSTPPADHLNRIERALSFSGVVLVGEGEVSTGGPGVRMGALGTSTGASVEKTGAEGNDNEARETSTRTLNG